jgi:uncharacterized protein YjcR
MTKKGLNKTLNKNLINIFKMVAILSDMVECAKKNCSEQKEKIMANKKANSLFNNYNKETDIKKKLKLANQYSRNNIIYEYTKCNVKYCKKIFSDLINLIKSFISVLPENDQKRVNLNKMITELETLFKKDELTKKEYNIYIKNITKLMSSITSTQSSSK